MNNNDSKVLGYFLGIGAILVLLAFGFQITGVSIFGVNLERDARDNSTSVQQTYNTPYVPPVDNSSNTTNDTYDSSPSYPTSIAGTWEGTYDCLYEGKANVTLVISGNEQISAKFYFSENRDNPSHPSGSFNMSGTYNSKEGIVKLDATTWIDQPQSKDAMGNVNALTNSVMMDMVATVTETGARIEGKLDPTSGIDICNKFSVGKTY
jgi:hypothetical protein